MTDIYDQCQDRGVYLLVEEAYSDFVLDEPFVSLARIAPDKAGAIVVNSLSKNMGMSGWRVGYTIAHPDLVRHLLKLNQHLITCAPSILSYYLVRYFDDILSVTLPQVRQIVEKRNRVAKSMDALKLKRLGGTSAFYFFISLEDFPDSDMDFALLLLLEKGVAVVPGSAYGASTSRFVRVSIGTEPEERVCRALLMIGDLIHVAKFDYSRLRARLDSSGIPAFR